MNASQRAHRDRTLGLKVPQSPVTRASLHQNLCHQARFPEKDPTGLNVSGPIDLYFEGVKDLVSNLFCGTASYGFGGLVSDCLSKFQFLIISLGVVILAIV